MIGPRDVPLGSLEEFNKLIGTAGAEPPEVSPLIKKIFDDMRGDDAGQEPTTSQKGEPTP